MVLAEAFMKRNDLKKEIAVMQKAASANLWQDKELPVFSSNTPSVKIHPQHAADRALEAMDELLKLNIAIAKANAVNNETLRELETTTAKLVLLTLILNAAGFYPGDKVREADYNGPARIIENEWLIDPVKVQEELADLEEHKRGLEKSLARSNFVTQVIM